MNGINARKQIMILKGNEENLTLIEKKLELDYIIIT